MATKQELEELLARRLLDKRISELTLAQVRDAVAGMTQADKAFLLEALRKQESDQVGRLITKEVREEVWEEAQQEAASLLSDDVLTLAELDRIFG